MAAIGLIRLTDEATFTLGGVKVAPAARTLAAGESVLVIEPRVMQVLVTLARHRGEVVGRERLVDACWDGRIVGEDSINRAILKLRRALSKVGGGVAIETVAKVGHRLRVSETASPADPTPPRVRHLRGWLLAGTVAVAASAIAALALKPDQAPETRRIVAVQPLQAATGDAPAR